LVSLPWLILLHLFGFSSMTGLAPSLCFYSHGWSCFISLVSLPLLVFLYLFASTPWLVLGFAPMSGLASSLWFYSHGWSCCSSPDLSPWVFQLSSFKI
jgi:hypothetical protein